MIRARNRVYRPGGAPSGQIESLSFFDTVAADAAHGSVTLERRFLNQTLTQTYTLTDYGVSALLSIDVAGVLELFYSCARKSLNPIDMWSGIRPRTRCGRAFTMTRYEELSPFARARKARPSWTTVYAS